MLRRPDNNVKTSTTARHVKMPLTANGRVRHVPVTRPTVPGLHLQGTVLWPVNGTRPLILVSPFHSSPQSLLVAPFRLSKCVLSIMAASGMVTTVLHRREQPQVRRIQPPATIPIRQLVIPIQRRVARTLQLAVPIQRRVARHLQPAKHQLRSALRSILGNVL